MLPRGADRRRLRRVVVAGVSTRAAAESAARAGFTVTAIDAFGDLDQHVSVRGLSLPRDFGVRFSAAAAAQVAQNIECDAVAYASGFENHPGAVDRLAAGRVLLGNGPVVLRCVRDPDLVTRAFRKRGQPVPAVRGQLAERARDPGAVARMKLPERERGRWLVKPRNSGGGARVHPWRQDAAVPRSSYVQELVDGTPGSVVFVAAGGRAVPLGMSRQLVGDNVFGAAGYEYCGSILAAAGDPQFARDAALVQAAGALAQTVAEEFGVVGINGIDFIARDGIPYAIEVNPRWSGSMELVERAYGLSGFGVHAAACRRGLLPEFDFMKARHDAGAIGKAIVFARRDATIGDTRAWIADASVRDVPQPGGRILAGQPVCTVFAAGRDSVTCYAALVRRAERACAELRSGVSPRHRYRRQSFLLESPSRDGPGREPMEGKRFIMNTGRTTKQGQQLNIGKDHAEYKAIVGTVTMHLDDMKGVGILSGGMVRIRSEHAEVTFRCVEGKVPPGMVFVPYGPPTCELMGRDTDGTGMPTSKGWEVEIVPVASEGSDLSPE